MIKKPTARLGCASELARDPLCDADHHEERRDGDHNGSHDRESRFGSGRNVRRVSGRQQTHREKRQSARQHVFEFHSDFYLSVFPPPAVVASTERKV